LSIQHCYFRADNIIENLIDLALILLGLRDKRSNTRTKFNQDFVLIVQDFCKIGIPNTLYIGHDDIE